MGTLHERFIAADVGGTHVRIGLVQDSDDPPIRSAVLQYRKYVCAQYPGLAEIIEDFIGTLEGETVSRGVIASAGYPLEDGTVITANLPWRLSPREIGERLGFRELRLVNDFEAVAHAAAYVDASEVLRLTGPETAPVAGPTLVLGPGTGLGAAVWIPTGKRAVVLATEAGQAALTAGNAIEMALLAEMLKDRTHVPVEYALSGPGLMNLHNALCALRGAAQHLQDAWRDHRRRHVGQRPAGARKPGDLLRPARQRGRRHGPALRRAGRHLPGRRDPAADPRIPIEQQLRRPGSSTRDRCARRWNAYPCAWSSTVNSASSAPRTGTSANVRVGRRKVVGTTTDHLPALHS